MHPVLLAGAAFVVMEPVTAATHRWVMHGVGWVLHRSHHEPAATRLEANDAFPVMFAGVVGVGLWAGFNVDGFGALVAVGAGVTTYGAAYALVHDAFIHGRVRWPLRSRPAMLRRLADAHAIHHRDGGAPYGMLAPIVPARSRRPRPAPSRERVATGPPP